MPCHVDSGAIALPVPHPLIPWHDKMAERSLLDQLIDDLRCLPSVRPKSAQRMAFHLLERDRAGGRRLARTMAEAVERIHRCHDCRTLSEHAH